MRRVVVTGMGIVSCIGNTIEDVRQSLWQAKSGLRLVPEMQERGFRLPVAGLISGLDATGIDRRASRTMSDVAKYAAVAAQQALRDAGVTAEVLRSPHTAVVVGTGGGGANDAAHAEMLLVAQKSPARLGAFGPPKMMQATAALNLATWLGVKGRCYSVTSACCTGTDNIGHGFELIRHGLADMCICGAAEEWGWKSAWGFGDAAKAIPSDAGESPARACRPFDRHRQGMVPAEGAGIVVLETLEQAMARGAPVYAELIGYGSANDGVDMFVPHGRGLKRCVEEALTLAGLHDRTQIDYINPHGAGTHVGDPVEVRVIQEVFGAPSPLVSSTKALSGHALAATGAQEAVFVLLMLQHGFITPTATLEQVAPECEGIRHVRSRLEVPLTTVMTFNSGLGGTNACLIFRKLAAEQAAGDTRRVMA